MSVDIHQVKEKLSENTCDLYSLCKSSKINPWSRMKPYDMDKVESLTESERSGLYYGFGNLSNEGNLKLMFQDLTEGIGGDLSKLFDTKKTTYNKPTTKYRLADFDGYDENPSPLFKVNYNSSIADYFYFYNEMYYKEYNATNVLLCDQNCGYYSQNTNPQLRVLEYEYDNNTRYRIFSYNENSISSNCLIPEFSSVTIHTPLSLKELGIDKNISDDYTIGLLLKINNKYYLYNTLFPINKIVSSNYSSEIYHNYEGNQQSCVLATKTNNTLTIYAHAWLFDTRLNCEDTETSGHTTYKGWSPSSDYSMNVLYRLNEDTLINSKIVITKLTNVPTQDTSQLFREITTSSVGNETILSCEFINNINKRNGTYLKKPILSNMPKNNAYYISKLRIDPNPECNPTTNLIYRRIKRSDTNIYIYDLKPILYNINIDLITQVQKKVLNSYSNAQDQDPYNGLTEEYYQFDNVTSPSYEDTQTAFIKINVKITNNNTAQPISGKNFCFYKNDDTVSYADSLSVKGNMSYTNNTLYLFKPDPDKDGYDFMLYGHYSLNKQTYNNQTIYYKNNRERFPLNTIPIYLTKKEGTQIVQDGILNRLLIQDKNFDNYDCDFTFEFDIKYGVEDTISGDVQYNGFEVSANNTQNYHKIKIDTSDPNYDSDVNWLDNV